MNISDFTCCYCYVYKHWDHYKYSATELKCFCSIKVINFHFLKAGLIRKFI